MSSLAEYRCSVLPAWIDYNGHMSEAFYVLVFGYATDQAMDALGLDRSYRERAGSSLYTVEAHVRYLGETGVDAALTVRSTVVAAKPKKLHLAHEMFAGDTLIATEELLALHVNADAGRATAFPDDISAAIEKYTLLRDREPPDWLGRTVNV